MLELFIYGRFYCNFESIKSMLASTMSEHSSTISLPRLQQRPRRSISWVRPEAGAIKFNVNAAVGLVYAAVAMVVSDQRGTLLFVCSKKVITSNPLHTEAEALKWAASLAAALSCYRDALYLFFGAKISLFTLYSYSNIFFIFIFQIRFATVLLYVQRTL